MHLCAAQEFRPRLFVPATSNLQKFWIRIYVYSPRHYICFQSRNLAQIASFIAQAMIPVSRAVLYVMDPQIAQMELTKLPVFVVSVIVPLKTFSRWSIAN